MEGQAPEPTEPSQGVQTWPSQVTQPTETTWPKPTQPSTQPSEPPPTESEKHSYISVLTADGVVEMELEGYVLGVVLAEVPSSFEPEALKAQAVAARTAALYICQSGRHGGAVCISYGCCQAYMDREQYFAIGGDEQRLDRVWQAVVATAGEVMTYQGQLICAAYFSCSGGSTEDAVAVWGSEVPYLQAVDSPGEEFAKVFSDCFAFSSAQFQEALCVRLDGTPDTWFGEVSYTEGGGVASYTIGGVVYRGTTLRMLLGLRSTVFTVCVEGDTIFVETRGYGHRVGMSQYGAQAMALNGSDYVQILCHYYLGAEMNTWQP